MTTLVDVEASTRETVSALLSAWAVNDLDGTMECVHENAVYILHISETMLPFGGEARGREAIRAAFARMRVDFDYLVFRPHALIVEGERAHQQIEFRYRHRKSGEDLEGSCRCIFTVNGGLMTRCEEYHDAAKVEAFMRLFDR